jgi:ribosome-binding factor A
MAAPRNAKLADQIKVVIAQTLERRVKDPRLGFLTLTEVRLSGDNREATVFYTVLGDDAERAGTAAALDSPESAKQIEDLLAQVQAADAAAAASAVGKEFAGEADPYRKPREAEEDDEQ